MNLRTILFVALLGVTSLFIGCSSDDDSQPQPGFDYTQLYAQKLIIDNGVLELEGDFDKLTEQGAANDNIGAIGGTTETKDVSIKSLSGIYHTVEVVTSLDMHYVDIEQKEPVVNEDGVSLSDIIVKIYLEEGSDWYVTYNLKLYTLDDPYSDLYAQKIIIDDGLLELEGNFGQLFRQAHDNDLTIVDTGDPSVIQVLVYNLPDREEHKIEVVKSNEYHYVEIMRTIHAPTGAEQVAIQICHSVNDIFEPITYLLVFLNGTESGYSFTDI